MIRAVFFDVDDTLIDYDRRSRAAFHLALGQDADFALWLRISDEHFRRYDRGELSFEAMRETRMADFLRCSGRPRDAENAAAIERARFEELWSDYELFDDVLPCLSTLREGGLRLGVITNNEPVHQRHKLALVGLANTFDAVVISGAVGAAKPAQEIFRIACDEVGVPAAHALHVGDRLDFDAVAAAQAGLTGVWLDRRATSVGREQVPVVRTLAQLPELVA